MNYLNKKHRYENEADISVIYVKLTELVCKQFDCNVPIPIVLEPSMQEKRIRFRVIAAGIGPLGYLPHSFPSKYVDRIVNEKPIMQIDDMIRNKDGEIICITIKICFDKYPSNN